LPILGVFWGIKLIRPQSAARLVIAAVFLPLFLLFTGCATSPDFDKSLREITKPYRFSLARWEINTLGEEISEAFVDHQKVSDNGISEVTEYFAAVERIRGLESEILAIKGGHRQGDLASLEAELIELQQRNTNAVDTVERILERQIRETLSQQGIYNPIEKYIGTKIAFPPVVFKIERPPHLLVVSPRDRIDSIREVLLLPDIDLEAMESIEGKTDQLGVSSLVVELGGLATYPSFVTDKCDLQFMLDAAAEEWLHQYLAFKPLGFRYLLDLSGISRNYEMATMNETLAGIVSREIGAIIYESYYARSEAGDDERKDTEFSFDFNQEMREIRRTVDSYLARGEIEQAEDFMERKRQYLATKGYHIRKLNQAYFAFYGTYADRPTSISLIGVELKKLRSQCDSLKEFLETSAAMTSRQDLAESVR
jgi:hypothetical protein